LLQQKLYAQEHFIKLSAGVLSTLPDVRILESNARFHNAQSRRGLHIGISYDRYIKDSNLGWRTGLNVNWQKYALPFETVQSYKDFNGTNAILEVDVTTILTYNTIRLPLMLLYRKPLPGGRSYLNFAGGVSMDLYVPTEIASNHVLVLINPERLMQSFHLEMTDNFSFDSTWRYSLQLGASYNYLLNGKRYIEFGALYSYSPVSLPELHLGRRVNHESFHAKYQIDRLDFVQLYLGYSLNRVR
jgi:hypothetical protein